ncbi:beta-ketoacyl-[acyl-carrier-protein] synthase family protein [Patescibacteria group bacterium]|nr:beta-ketoacyl-[acyl-carrier-protein] synthase family protein [Patescibacteria group bacterium]
MTKNWKQSAVDLSVNLKELNTYSRDVPSDAVAITGYAELTSLGNTRETEEGELIGKSGTMKYEVNNFRSNIAAPTKFNAKEYFSEKELGRMSGIGAMGIVLSREAGKMAGVIGTDGKLLGNFDARRAGCTVSTGIGACTKMVDVYLKIHWKVNEKTGKLEPTDPRVGSSLVSPFAGLQLFPEELGGDIEAELGLQGWGMNSSEACATGLSSIVDAYHLIKTGKNSIVFAGGIEDTLSEHPELSIGVFSAMRGPLSARNDTPEKASRPFDKDRDGFVLASGGGVVVLERLDSAIARKATIYAVILGAEKGSDGYSSTNLNNNRVAQLILKTVELPTDEGLIYPIDAIFAHATATKSGDAAEIKALRTALGTEYLKKIPITAIKSMHGHLAGGAGAVNTISAVRAIEKGFIPPIINLDNVDEPFKDLNLIRGSALKGDFSTALVLAYGFHGKDAALLIAKYIE